MPEPIELSILKLSRGILFLQNRSKVTRPGRREYIIGASMSQEHLTVGKMLVIVPWGKSKVITSLLVPIRMVKSSIHRPKAITDHHLKKLLGFFIDTTLPNIRKRQLRVKEPYPTDLFVKLWHHPSNPSTKTPSDDDKVLISDRKLFLSIYIFDISLAKVCFGVQYGLDAIHRRKFP